MKPDFLGSLNLIALTVLLVYDFFPNVIPFINIPKSILIGLLILTFVISIVPNRFQKDQSSRLNFKGQLLTAGYIFTLIIIFTLVGGVSQVGISLTNPVMWVVMAISVFDIVKVYKEEKVSQLNSEK